MATKRPTAMADLFVPVRIQFDRCGYRISNILALLIQKYQSITKYLCLPAVAILLTCGVCYAF